MARNLASLNYISKNFTIHLLVFLIFFSFLQEPFWIWLQERKSKYYERVDQIIKESFHEDSHHRSCLICKLLKSGLHTNWFRCILNKFKALSSFQPPQALKQKKKFIKINVAITQKFSYKVGDFIGIKVYFKFIQKNFPLIEVQTLNCA